MSGKALWEMSDSRWCVGEDEFIAARAGHSETLFVLANGYHGMRGSLETAPYHGRPGAFFAGLYDRTPVCFDQLANAPDWTDLEITAGGVRFDPLTCRLLEYRRTLDMRQALLFTVIRWRDSKGHRTRYESCRLVHATHKQRGLLWGRVTPENWSGELVISGGIRCDAANRLAARASAMYIRHLVQDRLECDDMGVVYEGHASRYGLPLAMRTRLLVNGRAGAEQERRGMLLRELHRVGAVKGRAVMFEKFAAFQAIALKKGPARARVAGELKALQRMGIARSVAAHTAAWRRRWGGADVRIDGNDSDQAAVRFSIFHLMQSACGNPLLDVSIGAKGLHGEGYNGHIFWDTEIFMLPFFAVTEPALAKSFLLYRYRRLPAARAHAALGGWRGAQFPWQSSLAGSEVTDWESFDPVELKGEPYKLDPQHQITASVAMAVDWYRRMSGDEAFYYSHGARLLVETAQFWASRLSYDRRRSRYVIRKVKCVDEYHQCVDNDAYTCFVAAENLRLGIQAARDLGRRYPAKFRKLCRETGLARDEIARWSHIQPRVYFPLDRKTGMIEQFDGYFGLVDRRMKRDASGWPIVPKDENLYLGRTQLIKQADVVLLFYLFGDRFTPDVKRKNYHYYLARDTHDSSLSANTYAIVGLDVGEEGRAYEAFRHSAYRDLKPGTDDAGIHAACLGGTWQAVVNGFAGMRLWGERPAFRPRLPPQWKRLAFSILWRGSLLGVEITHDVFSARVIRGRPVNLLVRDRPVTVGRRRVIVAL